MSELVYVAILFCNLCLVMLVTLKRNQKKKMQPRKMCPSKATALWPSHHSRVADKQVHSYHTQATNGSFCCRRELGLTSVAHAVAPE